MTLLRYCLFLCLLLAFPALAQTTPGTAVETPPASAVAVASSMNGSNFLALNKIVRNDTEGTLTFYLQTAKNAQQIASSRIYILFAKQKYYPLRENGGDVLSSCGGNYCQGNFWMRFPLLPFTADSVFEIMYDQGFEPMTIHVNQVPGLLNVAAPQAPPTVH